MTKPASGKLTSFQTSFSGACQVLRCLIYKVHAPTAEQLIDYHTRPLLSTGFLQFLEFFVTKLKTAGARSLALPPRHYGSALAADAEQLAQQRKQSGTIHGMLASFLRFRLDQGQVYHSLRGSKMQMQCLPAFFLVRGRSACYTMYLL